MFNMALYDQMLDWYISDFNEEHWEEEEYKWEAVQCFQENWDIRAKDFADMLDSSLALTDNLLTSHNRFPRGMIVGLAYDAPEEVKAMYIDLFDESKDLYERVSAFKEAAEIIREKYVPDARNHFQDENAIMTYLWLRYPDKYYIYKFSEVRTVAKELESEYKFKKGAYADNIRNFMKFYDEINEKLKESDDVIDILKSHITSSCYPDPKLKTLTIDFGFCISRYYSQGKSDNEAGNEEFNTDEWFPAKDQYTPEISKDEWLDLLNNEEIIGPVWGGALAAFYDAGGEATCSQLAEKYNKSAYGISGNCTQLAKRIHKETDCPLYIGDDGKKQYWPILFQGKDAGPDVAGSFTWKLRQELYNALTEFDIMRFQWKKEDGNMNYWWLNASPKIWSYSDVSIGEEQSYTLYNDSGHKRRIFQNFLDARAGDPVIGYESNPVKQIVALGEISEEHDDECLKFVKTEDLSSPIDYADIKACPELQNMEYLQNPQGSLFKLTRDEYEFIIDMLREENPVSDTVKNELYTKQDFLNEVYMSEERYSRLTSLLKNKMNIILQGAPGVGKTYTAKRLAYSMMGVKDEDRIEFIQFHQNYSYEDFMMGYKPIDDTFKLQYGVFYSFCRKAASHPDKDYFFIIDEINRGNLSKIFGELLMMIEKDYRGVKTTLAYNGLPFSVPENLYIIGMMNTADRSLAMIDYALRRRFSFFKMTPGFDTEGFTRYQDDLDDELFDDVIDRIKELNTEIKRDRSLGEGFSIGHSYFCGRDECSEEWLREVIDYDIIPTLEEYWFDDEDKLNRWVNTLTGVFDD